MSVLYVIQNNRNESKNRPNWYAAHLVHCKVTDFIFFCLYFSCSLWYFFALFLLSSAYKFLIYFYWNQQNKTI
jgi:hypothetical protein